MKDYVCNICDMILSDDFTEYHRDNDFIYGHCTICDMTIVTWINHINDIPDGDKLKKIYDRIQYIWPNSMLSSSISHSNDHWHNHIIIRK